MIAGGTLLGLIMTEGEDRSAESPVAKSRFAPSDRPRRNAAVEGERAGADYFVLDLETGSYYALGEVGGFIWRRLDGSRSLTEIADEVTAAFEIDAEPARSDVVEFVDGLAELGLLAAG